MGNMTPFTLKAPAKVNFILEIQGKRPDGYHELKTVMQALELSDYLTFYPCSQGLKITCDNSQVPVNEKNIVYQAVKICADQFQKEPKLHIHIQKRIPIAAGMGGGSSDAATALLGLKQLWKLRDMPKIIKIAKSLGSDVPFFLHGGCALGIGRGERIYPWPVFKKMPVAVINPGFPVSTAKVYKKFRLRLTRKKACINMMRRAIEMKNAVKISGFLFNDLESVTQILFPAILRIKQELLQCGAQGVLMSGSGPTVFGLLPSQQVAKQIKSKLGLRYQSVIITRTCGRYR